MAVNGNAIQTCAKRPLKRGVHIPEVQNNRVPLYVFGFVLCATTHVFQTQKRGFKSHALRGKPEQAAMPGAFWACCLHEFSSIGDNWQLETAERKSSPEQVFFRP